MVKDNGSLATVQQWGIFPPTAPPVTSLLNYDNINIDDFNSPVGDYTAAGFTGSLSSVSIVMTTLYQDPVTGAPGVFTTIPFSPNNIIPASQISVGTENDIVIISTARPTGFGKTSLTAFFQDDHTTGEAIVNNAIQGVVAAGATATITRTFTGNLGTIGDSVTNGNDYINLGLMISAELGSKFTILFDVGDGSFTQSYYSYTITDYVPLPNPGSGTGGTPGGPVPHAPDPGTPRPTQPSGVNAFVELALPISGFTAVGQAGLPGSTWANVNSWRIQIVNGSSTTALTASFNDFYLFGGGGPDASVGYQYDYRITFFNINTGDESGPSIVQVNGLNPINQPVEIDWTQAVTSPSPPLDPQITHVRVYRRGGTLPDDWLLIGQVPIGTNFLQDLLSDEDIAGNQILDTDTAPPVTSTLSVPVNTAIQAAIAATGENTVALGSVANVFVNQNITIDPFTTVAETVIVQSISGNNITAFFQYTHDSGAVVQASTRTGQPCNIGCIAFDRAWIAGDPNNPDILYYSDIFNPESFSVENFIEIGIPSDPIMAIMPWNGQLYVFTQNTVWNILGAQGAAISGITTPVAYKTAAKHGLNCNFGWTITEGEIWYQSFGGVYAFEGSDSKYSSEPIEWIFTDQFISDSLDRPVVMMDPSQVSQTLMSYYQNEVYVSYIGLDGNRHRVIWSRIYNRWRNDDAPANAMLVEDDTYKLLFGTTTGMIYQDRVGNFDSDGFAGAQLFSPINFNVQTVALDLGMPKNFKVFNELTLDIDTGGIPVTITLLFDNGLTPVSLGTVTSNGRSQMDFNINAGAGQLSLNVSVQLTATIQTAITNPITLYEVHIRATPEAELRKSYDSYIMDFGTPDYKIVKQGWIEYMALDPAGITFNVYVGSNTLVTPPNNNIEFSFTLPQSLTRTSWRVRFPATKGRIWRWVATSAGDFRLYSDSRIEYYPVTKDKGSAALPFQQATPKQP
jgi:hypothetical protein